MPGEPDPPVRGEPNPARPFDPLAIAQVVARNAVPVVGILAFGWSAPMVLLLYFVDTMLALGVMFAGLAAHFQRGTAEDTVGARVNAAFAGPLTAAVLCVFIAVPLGMPLVFVGAAGRWEGWRDLLADPAFLAGVAWQAVAAFWSYVGLWRELQQRTPEQLKLKRRFALVFLRWFVVIAVVYSPLIHLGRFLAPLLVVVYAGASIFIEIAPDRFLRSLPGGADVADPDSPTARPRASMPGQARSSKRRK
jgi:hypothetical protein